MLMVLLGQLTPVAVAAVAGLVVTAQEHREVLVL